MHQRSKRISWFNSDGGDDVRRWIASVIQEDPTVSMQVFDQILGGDDEDA